MQTRRTNARRRRRRRHLDDGTAPNHDPQSGSVAGDRLGTSYAAGPMLSLSQAPDRREAEMTAEADTATGGETESMDDARPETALPFDTLHTSGQGEPAQDVAFNTTLRLQGRTDATFDGGRFNTEGVRVTRATGCQGCSAGNPCIRARGTLVATYSVTTTVTLPRAADFPNLRPCQRRRVQDAIDNILAPHEQQHVAAFNTYNGVTRRAFDLTLCRNDFDAAIQTMFDTEAAARQRAAQAASDALDPFHFDVNLDCEDQPSPRSTSVQRKSLRFALEPAFSGAREEPENIT